MTITELGGLALAILGLIILMYAQKNWDLIHETLAHSRLVQDLIVSFLPPSLIEADTPEAIAGQRIQPVPIDDAVSLNTPEESDSESDSEKRTRRSVLLLQPAVHVVHSAVSRAKRVGQRSTWTRVKEPLEPVISRLQATRTVAEPGDILRNSDSGTHARSSWSDNSATPAIDGRTASQYLLKQLYTHNRNGIEERADATLVRALELWVALTGQWQAEEKIANARRQRRIDGLAGTMFSKGYPAPELFFNAAMAEQVQTNGWLSRIRDMRSRLISRSGNPTEFGG